LDRESLVIRNKAMAEAFHTPPFRHRVRHALLRVLSYLPSRRLRGKFNRVLLIRPDHLGDMLLTTPAIHALKAAHPQLELHALVGAWSAQIAAAYPQIDTVLTLPFPGFSRTPKEGLRSPYQLAFETARKLRGVGYDAAIIFRPDHWWGAMVAHHAGIPRVIGYALPDVEPFLSEKFPLRDEHVVRQNLRLVESFVGYVPDDAIVYQYPVTAQDTSEIRTMLQDAGLDADARYFCIHPGAGTWVKLWDNVSWAKVADTLADQLNARPILTGSDHERTLARGIAQHMTHTPIVLAGETQVGQLAALFAGARVVLGPDSGPLHLASAVSAPTVTLFGPARLTEFATWGAPDKHLTLTSDIGCLGCGILDWGTDAPENHPCVREISVGRVLDAARRVVNP